MRDVKLLSLLIVFYLLDQPLLANNGAVRIASLSLASDEILMDLMPTCGGIKRLIALSTLADEPSMSSITQKSHQVKARVHSEPESLFSLKPDLVIAASFNRPELLRMIEARKIPLLTLTQFTSAEDIGANIEKIGIAIGCQPEALSLKERFLKQVQSVKPVSKPIAVVLYDPDMVIMGSKTLFDDLVNRAGAINSASKKGIEGWPKLSSEALLTMNPDAIIILENDSRGLRNKVMSHPAWGKLSAVKNQNFIFLRSTTAQSTSHYFAEGVEELRRKLPN